MAAPSTASQAFSEGVRSGSKFVSTQSKSAVTGSLKSNVAHFGYAFAGNDMSDAQAASMSIQSTYRATGVAFHGMDMAASGIVNGTIGTARGIATTIENAPAIAQAGMHGMQAFLNSPETIKTTVTNSVIAAKDGAIATTQFVQAAPGKLAEGARGAAQTVRSAPGKVANAAKDTAKKTSRFIREAPSKTLESAKKTGKVAAKNARHVAGTPGRAVQTVRTSAANAQKFVRANGGIMKTGMRLGKSGARAAGRASVSSLQRMAYKLAEGMKRLVMRVVGALAGVVGKFIFVPLIVVLAALLFIQSILPGWLYAFIFEETQHHSYTIAAMDDYPWRGGMKASGNTSAGCLACVGGTIDKTLGQLYNTANPVTNFYYGNCTDFVFWRVNRDKILRSGTDAQKKQVEEIRKRDYIAPSTNVDTSQWPYKYANLIPIAGQGNGGQWGDDSNMPGWEKVTDVRNIVPGDILSIKPGIDGNDASAGHVAYVYAVNQDTQTVSTENYGHAKYYTEDYSFEKLRGVMAAGTYVFKHDPENTWDVGTVGGDIDADTATPEGAQQYAAARLKDFGWDTPEQFQCLVELWNHESGWRWDAENPSGAYGIPQSLPADKMASVGSDYKTNGKTQIEWGLRYIQGRADYGSPCAAWEKWQSRSPDHWY